MSDFGRNLRQERERLGIALEEISKATKISVRLLQAIEGEDFDRLPGGVFNVNFVRQYARHLGLDEETVVRDFRRLTEPLPVVEELVIAQSPLPPEWIANRVAERQANQWNRSRNWLAAAVLLGSVMMLAAVYLAWSKRGSFPLQRVFSVAAAPAQSVTPSPRLSMPPLPEGAPTRPAPVSVSAVDPGSARSVPPDAAISTQAGSQPPASAPAPLQPAQTQPSGAATPALASAGTEPGAAPAVVAPAPASNWVEAPVRVEIQATGLVWVGAAADGKVRFEATLQAQQTRRIAGQRVVRLRVGDAAALAVTLNGQLQPSLGPKGQVRTVMLTPDGMQVVMPAPRPRFDEAPSTSGESPQPATGSLDSGTPNP